jgi:hypothetical protein
MTEEEVEQAAIQSALNMGPAEHMFHPDYGWVLRDGVITEAGIDFFGKVYEGRLVCPNPRSEIIICNCCMCETLLNNEGQCTQEFCLANPFHKKWETPKKASVFVKVKVFILGLFLTGCSSIPSDSFNNPIWDCVGSSYESKVKVYAPDEQSAINQAELAIEKFHVYNNRPITCVEE